MSPYRIPIRDATARYEIKGSIFLAEIRRIESSEEMRGFYKEMVEKHPKACHNCWAVISGSPNDSQGYGFSDDGEPSGSAGRPLFHFLSHTGLGQTGLVVTRYFGGIKLGVGGLVKAYTTAAQMAYEHLESSLWVQKVELSFSISYSLEPRLRHYLSSKPDLSCDFSHAEAVNVVISLPEDRYSPVLEELTDMFGPALVLN